MEASCLCTGKVTEGLPANASRLVIMAVHGHVSLLDILHHPQPKAPLKQSARMARL